jgi:hypothetical protein
MFSVFVFEIRHSNHRIGAHICTNHTVPSGTALWGGLIPGTSCQATISLSLRDKSHSPIERLALSERLCLFAPGLGSIAPGTAFPGLKG